MRPYGLEIDISCSFFCTSGKETVENLEISPGQLAPCKKSGSSGDKQCVLLGARSLYRMRAFYWLRCPLTVVLDQ